MVMKDKRLEEILNEVSGVFDLAYENAEDDADRDYINSVEEKLIEYLKEKGLIEED
jgi:hypothetical protein